MAETHQALLEKAFPRSTWEDLVLLVSEGVARADQEVRDNPLFGWGVGEDQRGDLHRVAVMRSLHDACGRGDLRFASEVTWNHARNCRHIELAADPLKVHVNRTSGASCMPTETPLRDTAREANAQLDLFEDAANVVPITPSGQYYGWLTFGADDEGRLTHVCLGIPSGEKGSKTWLARINLLKELRISGVRRVEPETPVHKPVVGFKPAIRELIENRDEQAGNDKGQAGTEGNG